jgi:hypothetical protein
MIDRIRLEQLNTKTKERDVETVTHNCSYSCICFLVRICSSCAQRNGGRAEGLRKGCRSLLPGPDERKRFRHPRLFAAESAQIVGVMQQGFGQSRPINRAAAQNVFQATRVSSTLRLNNFISKLLCATQM